MTTTRDHLLAAVREAAFEGAIDELTPASVARRGGAHRVTFYRFWPDMRSAVIEAFSGEIDRLVTVRDDDLAVVTTEAELANVYASTLERSLAEIRDRRSVYRKLFAWPVFHAHAHAVLRERAAVMISLLTGSGRAVPGAESGTAAQFIAGASVSVYAAWAASDAEDVTSQARDVIDLMPTWWPRDRASEWP